ncbi:MAG: chain-length determining protein [Bacteroidaceae bacterium]|nr:chain-length determining protein [Bacteroidaceae bacterium]
MEVKKNDGIIEILLLLWSRKKQLLINCFIGGVLAIIVAFSIPKQYTSTSVLAPEFSSSASLPDGLGTLASMAGVNIGGNMGNDAFYPELYPQIVSSTPFLSEILLMHVKSQDEEIETTLYEYLLLHQRRPWWTAIYSVPLELITADSKEANINGLDTRECFSPSKQQFMMLVALDDRIGVSVDKGNNVITINVTMQDPKIAAFVANAVSVKLQEYVEKYRSANARKDLEYAEVLYTAAGAKYREAQDAYANYANSHQNIKNVMYQIELDRLSNEKDLAFGVYSQIAQNLEMARARVQENTPVCVVMQPAYVPVKASSPKKMMMGLLYVFLAFFGTSVWIILKNRMLGEKE